jgi:uncharacterized protein YbbC (DUF1343 family)/CubicO group peptidase (beta-lactamase class C family)
MTNRFFRVLAAAVALAVTGAAQPATIAAQQSRSSPTGIDLRKFEAIDALIRDDIAQKRLPGAVVLVGVGDRVVYQKAFGNRALVPSREPMTLDTVFDLASLTKVVATTTSVMRLIEQGRLRLVDRVSTFIPGFERYGKADITIRHLMTHVSGLRPDVDLGDDWVGTDVAIQRAIEEVPTAPPGARFVYSDINFFLLGEIVHRISGKPLDQFAQEYIFKPLGMKDTTFNPPSSLTSRIAPTESCTPYGWPCDGPNQRMLRGVVHDPTARRMGGVAGHAGLFSTAADLAIFCRMLLNHGVFRDARVLAPLTVEKMATPVPGEDRNLRALGWDVDSSYSGNRGELLPIGSFGHTGFTGTSLWIDPATRMFVVFLSNRVHPDGKGDVTPLRARIATIAASALEALPARVSTATFTGRDFGAGPQAAAARPPAPVLSGLDALRADRFAPLRGKRVGLVTNHTGRARDGATAIDLFFESKEVRLAALFSPEHGIRGVLDANVPSEKDQKTGLVIHSLYGDTRRPTAAMLDGLDAIVIDLQDIGARFYTYITTTAFVLEEAAKRNLPVFVLDRPNPINGYLVEGPGLDKSLTEFIGYFPGMPVRHGMTLGEMARLFNGENKIGAALTVIPMQNWDRGRWFDETGLPWINPSPNMRNLLQATLYPGVGAIEYSNISVGRGTDTPFEQLGAPWIDGVRLAELLNARSIPGVRFYPVRFTPTASKYAKEECQGVFMVVTDRAALRPVRLGVELASALNKLYGARFELEPSEKLIGARDTITRIRAGEDPVAIVTSWGAAESRWRLLRAKYLLYR